ncbi:MAG: hypothetical protein ACYC64_02960 [Armatimonadota bacterium]
MKVISLLTIVVACCIMGCTSSSSRADVTFDVNTPGIVYSGNAGISGSEMQFAGDGVFTADVNLKPGATYSVYIKRFTRNGNECQFSVDIGGLFFITDYANNGVGDQPGVEWLAGTYRAGAANTTIRLYNGGSFAARVNSVRFVEALTATFDESTSGIVLTNNSPYTAAIGYQSGATPDDSSSAANALLFGPGCSISGSVTVQSGMTYNVISRRMVDTTGNLSYNCQIGSNPVDTDSAISQFGQTYDGFYETTFWRPYRATSSTAAVLLSNGGPWTARVDYVKLKPSPYIYFNVDTPGITYTGNASASNGAMMFSGDGVITGSVTLKPGVTYNVYIRRFTRNGTQCQFKVDLNNALFVTDYANSGTTDVPHVEWLSDTFTATSSSTSISLYSGGTYTAQVDCLRFEEMPASVFDESTPGIVFTNNGSYTASVGYQVGAVPDDGMSPNALNFGVGCSVSGSVAVRSGVTYNIVSRRMVNTSGNLGYDCKVGANPSDRDSSLSLAGQTDDEFYETTFWRPYRATSSIAAVQLSNGGSWTARVDNVKLKPSSYVYFNVDTPGIAYSGIASASEGAMKFKSTGVVTGTVTLRAGITYNVYIRRFTRNGTSCQFKVKFNGTLFVTDYANSGTTDVPHVEWLAGTYTPSTSSITVRLDSGGSSYARVDYVRFAAQTLTGDPSPGALPESEPIPGDPVEIGDSNLGITLDANRGYALVNTKVSGVEYGSNCMFPTFDVFDRNGNMFTFTPQDARWQITSTTTTYGRKVNYSYSGLSVDVTYEINGGQINISAVPISESTLKFRSVYSGSLVSIQSIDAGAEASGFLLDPYLSGEMIRFPSNRERRTVRTAQSWVYHAGFVGLGCNGHGLIVRSPQYGAVWTYGTEQVNGVYSLFGGLSADFRPRRDNPGLYNFWNIALVEPRLDIQLVPVADTNSDGVFNWVDLGVTYRNSFIAGNVNMDPSELNAAVGGKIPISLPATNLQNYSQLISQIGAINFTPQRWWLVGAHTGTDYDYTVPPYSNIPDPSHNGPGDYNYPTFKADALSAGAKIGLHEIFNDVCSLNSEWGTVPMRLGELGQMMNTWSGMTPGGLVWDYSEALGVQVDDGSFYSRLATHFTNWSVSSGDTWHWDVFTSEGGRQDFTVAHPDTHGTDYRRRIQILQYVNDYMGVSLTSEGLQEGMSEYCDFAYITQTAPGTVSSFASGTMIPLLPVLFQGKCYYAVSWYPAWDLLYGGKVQNEASTININDAIDGCFGVNVYWKLIADRTVSNVVKTTNGWTVYYTEGGWLDVNLGNMADPSTMWFTLNINGVTYTPDNPPATLWGRTATRIGTNHYQLNP